MFKLINSEHQKELLSISEDINNSSISEIVEKIFNLIAKVREDIPPKKKISYGRYSIIKQMGLDFYELLTNKNIDVFEFANKIYENEEHDQFVRSLAVQLISIYGLEKENLDKTLSVFEKAATDNKWEARECSAGFIRKLIKEHPAEMEAWYLHNVKSSNPLMRRFTCESIRPVADNKWFLKNPNFCFSVIESLYQEKDIYPRSSAGNSLSDWARTDKERVYKIVEELVSSGNKNSYWIAYRACRNLVKKEPIRVMDLLKIDEYKYKKNIFYRNKND